MSRWKYSGNLLIIAFVYVIFADVAKTAWGQNPEWEPIIDTKELTDALNNFGYKLSLQLLKESNNANVVLSPAATSGVLAEAMVGSVGKPYDELAGQLGLSDRVVPNRKQCEKLVDLLGELNSKESYSKTLWAVGAFVDSNYELLPGNEQYFALKGVDFKDTDTAKNVINDWLYNKTNGKIATFLKDALPTDTKVALISALYFSGQWEVPFVKEKTIKLPFETASGKEEQVDQMFNQGQFKYALASNEGFEILALPYNDGVTTLYALKPQDPKKKSLQEVLDSLDYEKINNIIGKMESTECVIRFPKLDLTSDLKLEKTLKQLGINSIFSPEEANFAIFMNRDVNKKKTEEDIMRQLKDSADIDTGLKNFMKELPNPGLYVNTVLQGVRITIDESGPEPAAAPRASRATGTLFNLNSPFYVFIRNEKTQLVTFSAVINDPIV